MLAHILVIRIKIEGFSEVVFVVLAHLFSYFGEFGLHYTNECRNCHNAGNQQ